ncbi:MAG: hypothetical protein IJ521_02795 [Schwartzia sp.]|nr:hypothetical protein [Schwartzia sp. (in: firmicutes)]
MKGKNVDLPEGTELYIQTAEPMEIYGLATEASGTTQAGETATKASEATETPAAQ